MLSTDGGALRSTKSRLPALRNRALRKLPDLSYRVPSKRLHRYGRASVSKFNAKQLFVNPHLKSFSWQDRSHSTRRNAAAAPLLAGNLLLIPSARMWNWGAHYQKGWSPFTPDIIFQLMGLRIVPRIECTYRFDPIFPLSVRKSGLRMRCISKRVRVYSSFPKWLTSTFPWSLHLGWN